MKITIDKVRSFDMTRLQKLIEEGDVARLKVFMTEYGLTVKDGKIVPDKTHKHLWDESVKYWDKKQLVTKINLNSAYGSLLNAGSRFYDKRVGQSTTLSGRMIVRHMSAFINEFMTGQYDHTGDAIIYGDTDSSYFSAWPMLTGDNPDFSWTKEDCILMYDSIADQVNLSFPAFMQQSFHCPDDAGKLIKAGREIVATRGLFITKKRYAVLIFDLDGKRTDIDGKPGKIKAMGLDLKRSDTPKFVQEFLMEILNDVLSGCDRSIIIDKIIEFKQRFVELPSWEKGTPKRVNNLTSYTAKFMANHKANLPGHVRAAVNWNLLRGMNNDNHSLKIVDGQKTIVCKLRSNPMGWTSIGYPIDEDNLPTWYKELPFDDELMQSTIVDKKIDNLLGELGWNLGEVTDTVSTFNNLFDF